MDVEVCKLYEQGCLGDPTNRLHIVMSISKPESVFVSLCLQYFFLSCDLFDTINVCLQFTCVNSSRVCDRNKN